MAFVATAAARGGMELQTRDLIWMTVLGAAARCALTVEEACRLAAELGGVAWSCPATVAACIDEMLRGGNLRLVSPRMGAATSVATTPAGLETLAMLALAELPSPHTSLGASARRVRHAVSDLLPREACSLRPVSAAVH